MYGFDIYDCHSRSEKPANLEVFYISYIGVGTFLGPNEDLHQIRLIVPGGGVPAYDGIYIRLEKKQTRNKNETKMKMVLSVYI